MRGRYPRAAAWRRSIAPAALCLPLLLALLFLLVWPMVLVLRESVHSGGAAPFQNYLDIFRLPRQRQALIWSLALSGAVAALSTVLCLPTAWLLVRREFFGKRLLRATLALPMSFSGVIVGFLIVVLLGRAGFVPEASAAITGRPWLSGLAYQFAGLVLGYLYFEIPRATLTLESALRRFEPQLENAARSLGATARQCFLWVVLPALWPALASTFSVTFSVSLGSFGVILILSTRQINLLPLEIFTQVLGVTSNRGSAAALSVLLIAVAFIVNYGARALLERTRTVHEPA